MELKSVPGTTVGCRHHKQCFNSGPNTDPMSLHCLAKGPGDRLITGHSEGHFDKEGFPDSQALRAGWARPQQWSRGGPEAKDSGASPAHLQLLSEWFTNSIFLKIYLT